MPKLFDINSSKPVLWTRLYYRAKPLIPWRLRLALRRFHARQIIRNYADTWPIQESACRKPADWSGWPEGKQFSVVLTHDVERKRGVDRVRELAELEMRLGFRSSFNLVPEGEYSDSSELREWLTSNGFEVGVHDLNHDGRLYESRPEFTRKAERINEHLKKWGAVGFRSGFMLRRLEWIEELNIKYDASTFDTDPFEPQPDGVGQIFPFWHSGTNGRPGFVELPYTLAQDSTLFLFLKESSIRIWQEKLDWIAQCGGMALVIVHPDYLAFDGEPRGALTYPAALYAEFLSWLKQKYEGSYWHALPEEVADFVRTPGQPQHLRG